MCGEGSCVAVEGEDRGEGPECWDRVRDVMCVCVWGEGGGEEGIWGYQQATHLHALATQRSITHTHSYHVKE